MESMLLLEGLKARRLETAEKAVPTLCIPLASLVGCKRRGKKKTLPLQEGLKASRLGI